MKRTLTVAMALLLAFGGFADAEAHWTKGNSKTFSKCFGKVNLEEMQVEWRDFVKAMSIRIN